MYAKQPTTITLYRKKVILMNMKKLAVTGAILIAGTFGAMGMADAATGIVNVNAVLSGNAAFQKAGKTVAAEQQKLQKEY